MNEQERAKEAIRETRSFLLKLDARAAIVIMVLADGSRYLKVGGDDDDVNSMLSYLSEWMDKAREAKGGAA